jgi:hypothetical protein
MKFILVSSILSTAPGGWENGFGQGEGPFGRGKSFKILTFLIPYNYVIFIG